MNFSNNTKYAIAFALVSGWAVSTVYFFWDFQFRNVQSFIRADLLGNSSYFDETEFTTAAESIFSNYKNVKNGPYVFSFIDTDCPCSKFTNKHIEELKLTYQGKGIQFVTIKKGESSYFSKIPASPAAAVMDEKGKLIYFGPFSDQAVCGAGSGFIEPVLDDMLRGTKSRQMNLLATGCFCRKEIKI